MRPLLARAKGWLVREGTLTEAGLVAGLGLMLLGAWFTDLIGLHAMPRGVQSRDLIGRI